MFGEQLAHSLSSTGWKCDIVALQESGSPATIQAPSLVTTAEAVDLSGLSLTVARRLRARIRQTSPDVLLAGGGATLKYAVTALLGLRSRTRLVYSSIGEPEYWARSRLKRLMLAALLKRADVVTAVSVATAEQLTRSFNVRPDRIRVTPTGAPERFLDVEPRPSDGVLQALFIGSLSTEKNPLAALEVFGRMKARGKLRMVGTGPLEDMIRSRADEDVVLIGPVPDVAPQLEWADVLLITSQTEGLPGVALEASAARVPVVAFNVGGLSEIIEDGETGFLVDTGDVAGMARALDRLAEDPDLLASMSRAARERIRNGFLMSHALDRYTAVLSEACPDI